MSAARRKGLCHLESRSNARESMSIIPLPRGDPTANVYWRLVQGSTVDECPEIGVQLVDRRLEILGGDFLAFVGKLLAEYLAHDPGHGLFIFRVDELGLDI